ncbi:MAG: peptidoglycan DD-metalloendopeptidase family protein [Alphaproteobacteria bacterium]|jgi:murein DD-endopeptidase MepM/ murein hydrolase activator NlpD|nr:peptidoglycan DD-metalloendopeptidase family protein [Alphaproteobacteria bacterium]
MRKPIFVTAVLGAAILIAVIATRETEEARDPSSVASSDQETRLVSAAHANTPALPPAEVQAASAPANTSSARPDEAGDEGESPALETTTVTPKQVIPTPVTKDLSVARGDTLIKLLTRGEVPREQAHAVVTALKPVYDLRRMAIGQTFTLIMTPEEQGSAETSDKRVSDLVSLAFRPDVDRDILVRRDDTGGFKAEVVERLLERHDTHAEGRISTSLYDSAIEADLPIDVLMRLIQVFSFDVDFQREVQPGDGFELLYDTYRDEFGEAARTGDIVWAAMTLSGKKLEYARFKPKGGFVDYYNRKGQSVKKTLMRTPINGARLSSRFGKRRHPVLGYTKLHRGVDFAAPTGVPIMAAGDGVIEVLGRNGSYGKYIRIRHNSTYKTAYAHMSGYARGLKKGTRVRQGRVIGYVGSTGRSTGPHLHYEVIKNGRQTNPMSVRLPAGDKLKGNSLKAFLAAWPEIDTRVAQAKGGDAVAGAPEASDAKRAE